MSLKYISSAVVAALLIASPSLAQECGTVGTGGSAAAGGTSASSLGTAGACGTDGGTTASIGSGGSAAAAEGKAQSRTKVSGNPNQLKAQSKAQAVDQGTFSKSKTKTRVKDGELRSRKVASFSVRWEAAPKHRLSPSGATTRRTLP
jgi:hypothetical protein